MANIVEDIAVFGTINPTPFNITKVVSFGYFDGTGAPQHMYIDPVDLSLSVKPSSYIISDGSDIEVGYIRLTPDVIGSVVDVDVADIVIDFEAIPSVGVSPMGVRFVPKVTFNVSNPEVYSIVKYRWFFDFANAPTQSVETMDSEYFYVYKGKHLDAFTVRLEVDIKY